MTRSGQKFLGFLGLFILVLIFLFFWSEANDCRNTQDCGTYPRHTEKHNQGKDPETLWERTTSDPIAFYTLWLTAFTAVLALASIWQGRLLIRADRTANMAANAALTTAQAVKLQTEHMEASVREAARNAIAAEDQARISQQAIYANERAWIGAEIKHESGLFFSRIGNADVRVQVQIKNFGKTPAINVHTYVWMIASQENAVISAKEIAATQRKASMNQSRFLVPQDSYERTWGATLDAQPIFQETKVAPKPWTGIGVS